MPPVSPAFPSAGFSHAKVQRYSGRQVPLC
nr:MAG TPA: hypothetical protein [Caudoviricetes sp.]